MRASRGGETLVDDGALTSTTYPSIFMSFQTEKPMWSCLVWSGKYKTVRVAHPVHLVHGLRAHNLTDWLASLLS